MRKEGIPNVEGKRSIVEAIVRGSNVPPVDTVVAGVGGE
jgi:hypothetical protein